MNQRILVAEDDDATRRLLELFVRKWGFFPVLAADGEEAWSLLSQPDAPKIAIVDWMMPGMDGVEVVRRVRERSPFGDTFILMLTAKGSSGDMMAGLAVGADDYLTKPIQQLELEMRLRAGLRGRAAGEGAGGSVPSGVTGPGEVVGGRYRVGTKLGEGGMGTVFEAEHVSLGAKVAIKFMRPTYARDPEARARFAREARAASRVASKYVARVHDYGVTPRGEPYLVMDRLYGETLAQAIVRRGPLPLPDVARIVKHVAEALMDVHACGVLHRDVTPANVFLATQAGRESHDYAATLVDFGVAKLIGDDRAPLTREDHMAGTLEYMSPEALQGSVLDGRSDAWGLGVCAFEAVTGRSPFAGRAPGDTVYRVCVAARPKAERGPGAIPAAFQSWFERVCAVDPALRFADAAAAAAALAGSISSPGQRPG